MPDKSKEASVPKISSISSVLSIQYQCVTDRYRHTDTDIAWSVCVCVGYFGKRAKLLTDRDAIWGGDPCEAKEPLSRPHTMKLYLTFLVFLFLTVHPVFSGHLSLLTSCRFLALTLFSVLAPSVQPHQPFGIPFLTPSVHPIHSTLPGST